MEDNKEYVSFEDVEKFLKDLEKYIVDNDLAFSGVYGLPRGGLIPAIMLSYDLDLPLLLAPTDNCIIIDDIADSGRTLMHYTNNDTQFNKYFIATMYYRYRSAVKPDYYQIKKDDDTWIVFPWEV